LSRRALPPLLALAAAAALACRGAEPAPNVVLVSIDTLRADALGTYGGPPTPTLDRLAAEGVVFERAFAPTPTTAPSHATLFTGQDVGRHGLLRNGQALPDAAATLAEAFHAAGFRTAGFASSFVLDGRFGWGQGFETWDDDLPDASSTMKKAPYPGAFWAEHRFAGFDRRATATTQAASAWLAAAPEPFFLFVHYFDPHAPYVPPAVYERRTAGLPVALEHRALEGVAPSQLERLIRRYHAEVLYADEALGALLEAVHAAARTRGVLVVVTSDHGEGLGQHGWLEHAVHLYDEQVRVPLVLHWPDHLPGGRRVRTPVGLLDVAPTLAELAGLPPFAAADGRSLAAAARGEGEPAPRPLFGDRHLVAEDVGWDRGVKSSVRTEGWKLIRSSTGRAELYDLAADPGELDDAAERAPETAAALGSLLDRHAAALPGAAPGAPLSDETKEALRALGYAE
jgi:arylsulfatase A-like enzyme